MTRRYETFEDDRIDDRLGRILEPVATRRSVAPRLAVAARSLVATRGRVAACVVLAGALVAALLAWAIRPSVSVATSLGPARAACGIDVFVYGHPDGAVAQACRRADATHFAVFLVASAILVAGATAGAFVLLRDRLRTTAARVHAGAVVIAVAASVVGALALRPARVQLLSGGVVVTARCGADTYWFGHPDDGVRSACRHAYASHAPVLVVAAVVVVLAVALIGRRAFTRLTDHGRRRRFLAAVIAGALALVALVALTPKTVRVDEGTAPVVAACGVDTFLAGYPDRAVERSCRSRFAADAVVGLGAVAAALVLVTAAIAPLRQRSLTTAGPGNR